MSSNHLELLASRLLKLLGYDSFYPPQKAAIDAGVMTGQNVLLTTPTASGKTLVAMLAIASVLAKRQKCVYLTPLRALASEKFEELRRLEDLLGDTGRIRTAVSTGDYDSTGRELAGADVIVITNEKMDSLFRHGAEWLGQVGLFISDEVHLISDRERGPTLEMMLTRIRERYPQAQLIALSATVANSSEIADWLGCKPVESKWRPTKLIEGVFDYDSIRTNDGKGARTIRVPRSGAAAAIDVALQSLSDGGQALIFAETRKRAVSIAVKASDAVFASMSDEGRKAAGELSSKILRTDEGTETTKVLSELARKGVGFHHAGLGQHSRQLIEDAFKSGTVRLLTATPTLAAGVNLPARRVVLASVLRYDSEYGGSTPISVLEYKQLSGRAGRPKYDTFGESIIVSEQSGISADELYDHYVLGEPEPLKSRLSSEKAVRFHLLSTIASDPGLKHGEILGFFSKTLLAQQSSSSVIEFKLSGALEFLEKERLILLRNQRFIATEFGKRVSQLYIDPLTAVNFREALDRLPRNNGDRHTLGFLHLISNCSDFYPKLALRKKDYEMVSQLLESKGTELFYSLSEYESSRSFWALAQWLDEASEAAIGESTGIEPGDLHRIVEVSRWLSSALYEVAKISGREDLLGEIGNLRTRIRYGVGEELLPLVSLEEVGRVRARALFRAGYTDVSKLAKSSESKIAAIDKIGPAVAKKIKDQLKQRQGG
ncbi:MAG: DEAD/DEAH box helicase [Nitrososphaera sp.]|jgi:helicase